MKLLNFIKSTVQNKPKNLCGTGVFDAERQPWRETRSGSRPEKGDGSFNVWNAGYYRNTVVSAVGLNFSLKGASFRAVSGHRKDIYAKNLVKTTKLPMRGINERI